MMRYGHIAWRLIAVVAFAGTAALAVTLTRVPVRDQAALSSNSAVSTCTASGLEAWLGLDPSIPATTPSEPVRTGGDAAGPGVQAAGGTSYALEFTNVSAHACGLYGYPDVSAYAGGPTAGTQIGTAATDDTSVRPRPVVLAPGATAHSVLRVTGVGSLQRADCGQVTAPELRVMLPDSGRPAFVAVRFPACSKKGSAFMSVQPIQARAGIPGRTVP